MIEILYRVIESEEFLNSLEEDSLDDGSDIHGFFALKVNGHTYGIFHDEPLKDGEAGWEKITDWFIYLAQAYQKLYQSEYVAVRDTDSYNTWIEFKRDDDCLLVSLLETEQVVFGSGALGFAPPPGAAYAEWCVQPVSYKELYEELTGKIQSYLSEVESINPRIIKGKYFRELAQLLDEILNMGVIPNG